MPTDAVTSRPLVRPSVAIASQEFEALTEVLSSLDQAAHLIRSTIAELEIEKSGGRQGTAHWLLNQRVGAAVRLAQAAQILLGGDGRR